LWESSDPSQLPTGNISGKALNGQQQQVDMTNYHYYDNLTKSIAQTGRIILDLIPKIYDSERVMRIIGVDGKPDLITINEATQVGRVLNDVTVGDTTSAWTRAQAMPAGASKQSTQ